MKLGTIVLLIGIVGLYQSTIGTPSGADVVNDYKTCCCMIVPLQGETPLYDHTVTRQIESRGKDCNAVCEYYDQEGWVYGKEGYCSR